MAINDNNMLKILYGLFMVLIPGIWREDTKKGILVDGHIKVERGVECDRVFVAYIGLIDDTGNSSLYPVAGPPGNGQCKITQGAGIWHTHKGISICHGWIGIDINDGR